MSARLVQRKEPGGTAILADATVDKRVILSVIVGQDGRVTSIRPLTGWRELQMLMYEAVSQWVYRPWVVNNQPVEVESEVVKMF